MTPEPNPNHVIGALVLLLSLCVPGLIWAGAPGADDPIEDGASLEDWQDYLCNDSSDIMHAAGGGLGLGPVLPGWSYPDVRRASDVLAGNGRPSPFNSTGWWGVPGGSGGGSRGSPVLFWPWAPALDGALGGSGVPGGQPPSTLFPDPPDGQPRSGPNDPDRLNAGSELPLPAVPVPPALPLLMSACAGLWLGRFASRRKA